MNSSIIAQQIDIEAVIKEKNPNLLRLLPSPLLKYLKRVIHLDEFNRFLAHTRNMYDHDFVNEIIKYVDVQVTSKGLENIPDEGGCIIVCNHPLGGMDGIAVMSEVQKRRKDIKVLVNDLLMNLKNLNSLLVPVNKHGKNTVSRIKLIDQSYSSDGCVIVFPAGLVSRKQKGEIKDLPWKKSFITKAVKYKRNIIPVFIEARNSEFFYNLASLRKKIGIKTNIEMFFLVDEAYKQKGKRIRINIGAPITHGVFTREHSDAYWAEMVKHHVYALATNGKIL